MTTKSVRIHTISEVETLQLIKQAAYDLQIGSCEFDPRRGGPPLITSSSRTVRAKRKKSSCRWLRNICRSRMR